MCSPMIGQCLDTMIVASSDGMVKNGYNDPSKANCYRLM